MSMGLGPEKLAPRVAELRRSAEAAGRPPPGVATFDGLPLDHPGEARDRVAAWQQAGVTRIVHRLGRYTEAAPVLRAIERLAKLA